MSSEEWCWCRGPVGRGGEKNCRETQSAHDGEANERNNERVHRNRPPPSSQARSHYHLTAERASPSSSYSNVVRELTVFEG